MIGRKLKVYCPNCEDQLEAFTEVTFLEDFRVLIKSECCGNQLQLILDILSLLPQNNSKNEKAN
jgi:hypothetical protein